MAGPPVLGGDAVHIVVSIRRVSAGNCAFPCLKSETWGTLL